MAGESVVWWKHWWIWVALAVLIAFGYQQYRISSLTNMLSDQLKSELKRESKEIRKENEVYLEKYVKDLQVIKNQLSTLEKSRKQIDKKLSETEKTIEKVKKEKLTPADIDKRLDELFPRNGVGTP